MSTIAAYLQDHITKKGLVLTAAAVAIGVTGVALRKVLAGKAHPNARTISKYAKFLGMPAEALAKAKVEKKAKGKPSKRGKKISQAFKGPKAQPRTEGQVTAMTFRKAAKLVIRSGNLVAKLREELATI